MAVAREHNHELIDLSLREFASLLDLQQLATRNTYHPSSNIGLTLTTSDLFDLAIRLAIRVLLWFQSIFPPIKRFVEIVTPPGCGPVNLDDPAWGVMFQQRGKLFIFCDWYTRAPRTFAKHKSWLLDGIVPEKGAAPKIASFVSELREEQMLLVGIVVRREDYKEYEDGKYFFSMDAYRDFADRMLCLLSGQRVRFFICSIDEEDVSVFEGIDFSYRFGHPIENLYTLSECDYLISPPSTYAMWAALVGTTPSFFTEYSDAEFNLDDFSIVSG